MPYALIRHGQTDWNLAHRMQGSSDIPLNDTGRDQARAAAELLAEDGPWDAVVSSPLIRARETAQLLATRLGLELGPTYDDIREQHFGVAEGMQVGDIPARWPDWRMPEKEDDLEVGPRGIRALERVRTDYGDARVLIVAHGTVIRYTLSTLAGEHYNAAPGLENLARSDVEWADDAWRVLSIGGVAYPVAAT